MPKKAMHFCNWPGCDELTDKRYCPAHQSEYEQRYKSNKAEYDKTRQTANKRGYDSTWGRVRKVYLVRNPLCEMCKKDNRIVPAVLVHHIKPLSEGGSRLNSNNLMALCKNCHEDIHGKDRFKRKQDDR